MLRRDTIRTYGSQVSVLVNTPIVLLHAALSDESYIYQAYYIYQPINQSKMRCRNTYKLLTIYTNILKV